MKLEMWIVFNNPYDGRCYETTIKQNKILFMVRWSLRDEVSKSSTVHHLEKTVAKKLNEKVGVKLPANIETK